MKSRSLHRLISVEILQAERVLSTRHLQHTDELDRSCNAQGYFLLPPNTRVL
jgi:hypothetical protein